MALQTLNLPSPLLSSHIFATWLQEMMNDDQKKGCTFLSMLNRNTVLVRNAVSVVGSGFTFHFFSFSFLLH